jgi:hypothetical protein
MEMDGEDNPFLLPLQSTTDLQPEMEMGGEELEDGEEEADMEEVGALLFLSGLLSLLMRLAYLLWDLPRVPMALLSLSLCLSLWILEMMQRLLIGRQRESLRSTGSICRGLYADVSGNAYRRLLYDRAR